MDTSGNRNRAEYYGLIRSQIDHQDELVNQRVIWQIITQAFFFSAYTSLLNAQKEAKTPMFEAELSMVASNRGASGRRFDLRQHHCLLKNDRAFALSIRRIVQSKTT